MERVCVVGAGSAGLAVAQALADRGVPFRVLEAREGLGGNWRYEAAAGRGSCYDSLTTNVSRWRTSYRTFRLPRRGSAFLHHTEMLAYLEAYADRFGLREHIRFGAEVTRARPVAEGWEVEVAGEAPHSYRALVVAAGYNSVPQMPTIAGPFDGLEMHAHDYRNPQPFRDKHAVVVGMGCSGTELASEIAAVAQSVALSVRGGHDIVGRRLGPIPMDLIDTRMGARIPWRIRRRGMAHSVRISGGDQVKAGLPPGPERVGDRPFAVSDHIVGLVQAGRIAVAPEIVEKRHDEVRFANGDIRKADAILYATGYKTEFPFLPGDADLPSHDRAPLYRGVVSLSLPHLFFVGIVGGHGALIPMFEAQAQWTAHVLAGHLALPSAELMKESVNRDAAVRARDFDPRYGFLYDRLAYASALERELRHAKRRPGKVAKRAAEPTLR